MHTIVEARKNGASRVVTHQIGAWRQDPCELGARSLEMHKADTPVGANRCGPRCINSVNAVCGRPNLRRIGGSGVLCRFYDATSEKRSPKSRHLSNACHCSHHVLAPRVHDLGPLRKGLRSRHAAVVSCGVEDARALGDRTCLGCDRRGVQLCITRAVGGRSRSDAPEKAPLEVWSAGHRGSVLLRLRLHHVRQSRVHLACAARLSSAGNARSSRVVSVFLQRCAP